MGISVEIINVFDKPCVVETDETRIKSRLSYFKHNKKYVVNLTKVKKIRRSRIRW